jgi:hypothetical protein
MKGRRHESRVPGHLSTGKKVSDIKRKYSVQKVYFFSPFSIESGSAARIFGYCGSRPGYGIPRIVKVHIFHFNGQNIAICCISSQASKKDFKLQEKHPILHLHRLQT